MESSNYASGETFKQPLLLRKQNLYNSSNVDTTSSTSSLPLKARHKLTLDNPFILEQQLEALEHHKKQLEKLGKLHPNSSRNSNTTTTNLNTPKLSSASLLTDGAINLHNNFLENTDITYANASSNMSSPIIPSTADNINSKSNVFGNILPIYSNVAYHKNQDQTVCAEEQHNAPASKMVFATKPNVDSNLCSVNNSLIADDEIQPPASPVSSSYSELRRATEVFKTNLPKKAATINSSDSQMNIPKTNIGYEVPTNQRQPVSAMDTRQLYSNKSLYATNDGFGGYNTVLQVLVYKEF